MDKIELYTDGACSGNPGRGGWAAILIYKGRRKEISGGFRLTTNNRMELTAVVEGLKAIRNDKSYNIIVYSDSQYLINSFQKGWIWKWKSNGWKRKSSKVPNSDIWIELLELMRVHKIEYIWVEGHAGVPENEKCDELARLAATQFDLPIDKGYKESKVSSDTILL